MCNCGSSASQAQQKEYVFTNPTTGREHKFNSRIEAQAAQVRAGGGGSIREQAK